MSAAPRVQTPRPQSKLADAADGAEYGATSSPLNCAPVLTSNGGAGNGTASETAQNTNGRANGATSGAADGTTAKSPTQETLPVPTNTRRRRFLQNPVSRYLSTSVDPKKCTWVSVYACFITGYTSAISFTACYVWPGFQTGNVAQLAIAIARTFDPSPTRTYGFQKGDQQALTALVAFWIGASLGRIGERMGNKTRRWLVLASIIQILLAAGAALLSHYSGESPYARDRLNPSWSSAMGMSALAFLAASLGLQGIIGKRIAGPMNTTVVLTTTWVEICNDPKLFDLKYVPSRDGRIAGALAILVGAFVARALLGVARLGGTVGILCGLRVIQAIWWLCVPSPPPAA